MINRFANRNKIQDYSFKLILAISLLSWSFSFSQYLELTPNAEVSVLTIGPGVSLNDAFGHSAYRIKDDSVDIVFNYGVYDFDTPNFYTKFAQGKLNYKIGANYYDEFLESYIIQNRTIKEQILNLTQDQKQQIFNYLSKNYEPENQYYLYDFFYDNCATKIKDVLVDGLKNDITFHTPEFFEDKTFRTLIQDNLNWNSWGSFGIDLALGSVIDQQATKEDHMFLPENIHGFFGNATLNNSSEKKLVKQERILFNKIESKSETNFFTSPLFTMLLMSLIILFITYLDFKKNARTKWLDVIIFGVTGIIGIILLLLWFATDHKATANNYNLLWAFALNLFLIGHVLRKQPKNWFKKYIKFLIIMLCLMALHWIVGVQRFALALIPLILALLSRYIFLIHHYKRIIR